MRLRGVKNFPRSHTAGEWRIRDSYLLFDSKAQLLTTVLPSGSSESGGDFPKRFCPNFCPGPSA